MEYEILTRTRESIYWKLFLSIPYEVLRFGIAVFVIRTLDPKDFGLMAIASMVILYANMVTNLSFNHALVQKDKINDKHITTVFTVDLFISIFLTALIFFLAPFIAGFFRAPASENVIKVLSLKFILTTFYNLPTALFRRNIDFKIISVVNFMRGCATSFITLTLVIMGFRVWALVYGQLIPLLIAAVYLNLKSTWKPKVGYDHASLKDLFGFGVWNFIRHQIRYFATHIDRLIIGRLLGAVSLGFYEKARSFVRLPINVLSTNVNTVLFSSFSRSQAIGKELKNLLKKSIVIHSIISFPVHMGIIVIAPYFVFVILGDKWTDIIYPLQILALSGFAMPLSGLFASFNVAVGNYKSHTIRLFLASLCFALSCLILVRFGLNGIASSFVGYSLLAFFLTSRLVFKKCSISLNEFVLCLAPSFLGSMSMLGIVKLFSKLYFSEYNLLSLSMIVLIGAAWYVAFIALFPSSILGGIRSSIYRDLFSTLSKEN
jgi:O-antigen/teichoic acid export membrane protein